jgi:hypothetical protein
MSSADPEEVSVEITREGVSVEKSFEPTTSRSRLSRS